MCSQLPHWNYGYYFDYIFVVIIRIWKLCCRCSHFVFAILSSFYFNLFYRNRLSKFLLSRCRLYIKDLLNYVNDVLLFYLRLRNVLIRCVSSISYCSLHGFYSHLRKRKGEIILRSLLIAGTVSIGDYPFSVEITKFKICSLNVEPFK